MARVTAGQEYDTLAEVCAKLATLIYKRTYLLNANPLVMMVIWVGNGSVTTVNWL